MPSDVNGVLRVLVWSEDGVVKALIDDNGRLPVAVGAVGVTLDVNIESSDIDVPVSVDAQTQTLDVNLESSDITLPVAEQSPLSSIQGQVYGWDLSNWRKLPMLWGYSDRWAEVITGTIVTTTWSGNTVAVPSGYVYVLQGVSLRNITTGPTGHEIYLRDSGAQRVHIATAQTIAAWRYTLWHGNIVLEEDDSVKMQVTGCGATDTIQAHVWGYMMKVNE